MKRNDLAILKGLVSVAWADGKLLDRELAVIDALCSAFGSSVEVVTQVREFAKDPRTLKDIPLDELGPEDRRHLLQHAVLLAMMDGEYHDDERALIEEMRGMLEIPAEEAATIYGAAEKRAAQMLQLM